MGAVVKRHGERGEISVGDFVVIPPIFSGAALMRNFAERYHQLYVTSYTKQGLHAIIYPSR